MNKSERIIMENRAKQHINCLTENFPNVSSLEYSRVEAYIISWLKQYADTAKVDGFVIGISGGIDSAVTSTLAAKTGLKLYVIQMHIHQKEAEVDRAKQHINWLTENFPNVSSIDCNLTNTFDTLLSSVEQSQIEDVEKKNLAAANTRSRIRMTALYYYASIKKCLVLGTGNKVEDFGIGFFTKYGDGGVDISPIGDLMKSEVRALGRFMGVSIDIINAKPTDGLWDDGRGDEDQVGATYDELEWAMKECSQPGSSILYMQDEYIDMATASFTPRQMEVLKIYKKRHNANAHKMNMPPICDVNFLREK